jgi:hypothetical protein
MAILQTKNYNRYMMDEWKTIKNGPYESLYKEMIEEYSHQGFTPGNDVRVLLTSEDKEFKEEKKLNDKFST